MSEQHPSEGRTWLSGIAILPAIGTTLLPALTCPACWPAYAGLLSVIGLGIVDYTPYLMPMTIGFLGLALFALGYKAKRRRGYIPLVLGIAAASLILIGKFFIFSDLSTYSGIAGLILASLWNSWPTRGTAAGVCPIPANQ